MSTTPINLTGAPPVVTNPTTTLNASTTSLGNENVFLQLLVAQLKYQDPTQPADGTEFVTQLAQFSDLSNTTDMASDLDSMKTTLASLAAASNTAAASSTPPATPATTPAPPSTTPNASIL